MDLRALTQRESEKTREKWLAGRVGLRHYYSELTGYSCAARVPGATVSRQRAKKEAQHRLTDDQTLSRRLSTVQLPATPSLLPLTTISRPPDDRSHSLRVSSALLLHSTTQQHAARSMEKVQLARAHAAAPKPRALHDCSFSKRHSNSSRSSSNANDRSQHHSRPRRRHSRMRRGCSAVTLTSVTSLSRAAARLRPTRARPIHCRRPRPASPAPTTATRTMARRRPRASRATRGCPRSTTASTRRRSSSCPRT